MKPLPVDFHGFPSTLRHTVETLKLIAGRIDSATKGRVLSELSSRDKELLDDLSTQLVVAREHTAMAVLNLAIIGITPRATLSPCSAGGASSPAGGTPAASDPRQLDPDAGNYDPTPVVRLGPGGDFTTSWPGARA